MYSKPWENFSGIKQYTPDIVVSAYFRNWSIQSSSVLVRVFRFSQNELKISRWAKSEEWKNISRSDKRFIPLPIAQGWLYNVMLWIFFMETYTFFWWSTKKIVLRFEEETKSDWNGLNSPDILDLKISILSLFTHFYQIQLIMEQWFYKACSGNMLLFEVLYNLL